MDQGAFSNLVAGNAGDGGERGGGAGEPAAAAGADASARALAFQLVSGVTVWRRLLDHHADALHNRGNGARLCAHRAQQLPHTQCRSVSLHIVTPRQAALDPVVRCVLRVGLYELLVLRAAPHAAVSQAVELARAGGRASAAGLVNAVLRHAARGLDAGGAAAAAAQPAQPPEPASPAPAATAAQTLAAAPGAAPGLAPPPTAAVRLSFPDWLADRWAARVGADAAAAMMLASNRVAAFAVRPAGGGGGGAAAGPSSPSPAAPLAALGASLSSLGVAWRHSALLPSHFLVVQPGSCSLAPLRRALASGAAALQDEAAALVVLLLLRPPQGGWGGGGCGPELQPQPPRLADVCAAPGGKALFAASLGARVTAVDASAPRLAALAAAAAAQRATLERVACAPAADFAASHAASGAAPFDCVLVDAPCTGTGVLSKRADLRWRRAEADVAPAARRQAALLAAAAPLVRPGGVLVYSTCSAEEEENQVRKGGERWRWGSDERGSVGPPRSLFLAWLTRAAHPLPRARPAVQGVVESFLTSPEGAAFAVDPPRDGGPGDAWAVPPIARSQDGRFLQTRMHLTGTDGAFAARLVRAG